MSRAALFLLAALALTGCGDSERAAAEKTLRRLGAERLRKDAALLYKQLAAAPALEFRSVKANLWPESFAAFKPRHVGLYRDGFSLALAQKDGAESGLYITPATMEALPAPAGRARFEKIAEGLHWYRFEH